MSLTLGQITNVAAPITDLLVRRRGLNNATSTVAAGADAAGSRIDAATGRAIGRQDATLGQQQGLHNNSVARQQPYAATGTDALARYQSLIDNPVKFDPATVMQEPGYQFGLDQTTKAVDRSGKGLFNRAMLDAKTKNVLDYATTRYNDAFNRFMATQKNQQDLIKGGVDIGQNANTSMDAAGRTLGKQMGANADKTGTLGVNAAEDRASLDLAKARDAAANEVQGSNNTANTIGKVASAVPGLIDSLAKGGGSAGVAGKTLGALTGTGSLLGAWGGTTSAIAAPGVTTAAGGTLTTAPSGLLGATHALLTNPWTAAVGGALLAGAAWLKSQAHWEANTAVKDLENPFHQNSLAPFAAQWDAAIKGGELTGQQGHDALDQYIQNFQDYTDKIQKWAGSSKDKKKVANQSIGNLYKTTIGPQVQRMTSEISQLPVSA